MLKFKPQKEFSKLNTYEQFILFELYSKQISYYLRYEINDELHKYDFKLNGTTEHDQYTMISTFPKKGAFIDAERILYKNDEPHLSSTLSKKQYKDLLINNNSSKEKEIFDYAV
ncbi:hypothetical protein [Bacillus massiliigorillae]|uniref:hypothetical protein n=1 Tax=Bacillus massiliigorillae TaxID=1243664 RepID=UPI0005A8CC02|nr:hypothetical protein [Bacillus massiliigorillae]